LLKRLLEPLQRYLKVTVKKGNNGLIKMSNQNSHLVTASTKDIITFLDEVRIALGLSQQQMDTLILLLVEAEGAHLRFRMGNIEIIFGTDRLGELDDREITVDMCTSQKNYASTISYKIPQIYLQSVKKKNTFVKSP
jgi:hypothetical protein